MINSAYAVVKTAKVLETAGFYQRYFGFEKVFAADWYVSLKSGACELAVLDPEHASLPGTSLGAKGISSRRIPTAFRWMSSRLFRLHRNSPRYTRVDGNGPSASDDYFPLNRRQAVKPTGFLSRFPVTVNPDS